MYDNYNYPAGADTPDAPWNQPCDPEPIDLELEVTMCLTHNTVVSTTNYTDYADDEDGHTERELHDGYKDVMGYYKQQHKSIPELLNELAKYIKGELEGNVSPQRRYELNDMLFTCEGWKVNDVQVEDYNEAK